MVRKTWDLELINKKMEGSKILIKYELTVGNGYGCKGGAGECSRTKFILKGVINFPINRSLK